MRRNYSIIRAIILFSFAREKIVAKHRRHIDDGRSFLSCVSRLFQKLGNEAEIDAWLIPKKRTASNNRQTVVSKISFAEKIRISMEWKQLPVKWTWRRNSGTAAIDIFAKRKLAVAADCLSLVQNMITRQLVFRLRLVC